MVFFKSLKSWRIMCGVNGILNLVGANQVLEDDVLKMNNSIVHRGPDGSGIYFDKSVGLGHQRLSIIDVASGSQPMTTEDERYTVVFNGEIYNYQSLKKELSSEGYRFKTNSDTEALLYSYVHWNEKCVDKLRGMFAFAIWDSKEESLFCARDRIGIKPFYYYKDSERFIFSSEIKAILSIDGLNLDTDWEAIDAYLTLGYVPGEYSGFTKIKKLKPGNTLTINKNDFRTNIYWDVSSLHFNGEEEISYESALQDLKDNLNDSVSVRLMSEVPLGAFLSGGVDSTSIVALMSDLIDKPVNTMTIGFNEEKFDESDIASISSKKYKTDHTLFKVNPKPEEIIEQILPHVDLPFMDTSLIPTYYVCKSAREKVTVVLSGDGGDELFAGYNWYPSLYKQAIGKGLKFLSVVAKILPFWLKGISHLENTNLSGFNSYLAYRSVFKKRERKAFYKKTYSAIANVNPILENLASQYEENIELDNVRRAQLFDMRYYMVDDILYKVDLTSMMNSLEVRVPLLDHIFVEKMFSLPTCMKYNGKTRKKIFREAMGPIIPEEVLKGGKKGFVPPVDVWMRGELKSVVEELLFNENAGIYKILKQDKVKKLWNLFLKNPQYSSDMTTRIWSLVTLELWFKKIESLKKQR